MADHPPAAAQPDEGLRASAAAWSEFQALVLSDLALQEQLRAAADWASCRALIVRLAAERDLAIDPALLEAALRAARRSWLERHL